MKRNHALSAKYPSVGTVYLIRDQSGLHKIGQTRNWDKRSRQLKIGTKTSQILTATVINPERVELTLHHRYSAQRLPQSEWFSLTPQQIQEVIAEFKAEAAKCQGSNADGHLALERMLYECKQLKPGSILWRQACNQIEAQRRMLCPEYKARAEAREVEVKAGAEARKVLVKARAELVRRLAFLSVIVISIFVTVVSGPQGLLMLLLFLPVIWIISGTFLHDFINH